MTPEEETLLRIARGLESEAIPYMVAGSFASSYHGRPRATHDADVVIDPTRDQLARLVKRLGTLGFYVDAARAADAFERRRQFNVIDPEIGWKVDLIIRKDRPFSQAEMARRQPAQLAPNETIAITSPEDTVISKLEWARQSGESGKQLADVAGVLEVTRDLDRAYIERWAAELGLLDLWRSVSSRTDSD
ncbi:MAG TPA: hypothetical protein VI589_12620 [Vicinamibacteria bacterium]